MKILAIMIIVAMIPIAMFIFLNTNYERAPDLFSLNNPQATYSIKRIGLHYWLSYQDRIQSIDVLIGKSKADISGYIDKLVLVKGRFRYASSQCIAATCHLLLGDLRGRAVSVDIDEIQIAK